MKKTLQLFGQSKLARGRRLDVATTVMHFGYGAGCGAVFGLAAPRFQTRGARGLVGLGFGAAVWAASYAAWIPALGLMPTPPKDQPLRPTVMVLAHLIFGALLGLGYRK